MEPESRQTDVDINEEKAIDYLYSHVIILGLPRSIDVQKLRSSYGGLEKISRVRILDDPTFIGTLAAIFQFDDSAAANSAAARMSLMLRRTRAVALNAAAYISACSEHLESEGCIKKPPRIIARGLTPDAASSAYLTLFRKFGNMRQYRFMRLDSDYVLLVEYSCAIESLAAELALSGREMESSTWHIQRVPNCKFRMTRLKHVSYLLESNIRLSQNSKKNKPKDLPSESAPSSSTLLDLGRPLAESSSSSTQSLSSSDYMQFSAEARTIDVTEIQDAVENLVISTDEIREDTKYLEIATGEIQGGTENLAIYSEKAQKATGNLKLSTVGIQKATENPVIYTEKTLKSTEYLEISTYGIQGAMENLVISTDEVQEVTENLAISTDDIQRQLEIQAIARQTLATIERDVKAEMAKQFGAIPKKRK